MVLIQNLGKRRTALGVLARPPSLVFKIAPPLHAPSVGAVQISAAYPAQPHRKQSLLSAEGSGVANHGAHEPAPFSVTARRNISGVAASSRPSNLRFAFFVGRVMMAIVRRETVVSPPTWSLAGSGASAVLHTRTCGIPMVPRSATAVALSSTILAAFSITPERGSGGPAP